MVGCQSSVPTTETSRTFLKVSSAATTSAPFQSVLPSHSPLYLLVPNSPNRTFSSRCSWVHVAPTDKALMFLALSVSAWARNSVQVLAGAEMPHSVSFLGEKNMRLKDSMFT